MINEGLWINPFHGLELEPGIIKPNWRGNENGILFLVEYYFLKHLKGELTQQDIDTFRAITERLQAYDLNQKQIPGLYDRGARESITIPPEQRRTISRDNLLAIGSFSYLCDLKYADDIYKHGMKNLWRFDNCYPEKPRWARFMWNIPDIFAMCYYSKKPLAKLIGILGLPLIYGSNIYSVATKYKVRPDWYHKLVAWIKKEDPGKERKHIDTSGPWLTFMKMYPLVAKGKWHAKLIWKLCTWYIDKHFKEGWKFVGEYYFKHPEHPNHLLMTEAWKKDSNII